MVMDIKGTFPWNISLSQLRDLVGKSVVLNRLQLTVSFFFFLRLLNLFLFMLLELHAHLFTLHHDYFVFFLLNLLVCSPWLCSCTRSSAKHQSMNMSSLQKSSSVLLFDKYRFPFSILQALIASSFARKDYGRVKLITHVALKVR